MKIKNNLYKLIKYDLLHFKKFSKIHSLEEEKKFWRYVEGYVESRIKEIEKNTRTV